MPSANKAGRGSIDTIRLLDDWIEIAEHLILSRWTIAARTAPPCIPDDTLRPLLDLLSILHLMHRYRDQLLDEIGYGRGMEHSRARFVIIADENFLNVRNFNWAL